MNNIYRNQNPREIPRGPMINPREHTALYPIDMRGPMTGPSMPGWPLPGPSMPGAPMPGTMEPIGHYMNEELVRIINDCASTCEHMTHHIKELEDSNYRLRQASLLRECAEICQLTANYLARGSEFSKQSAAVCAEICEICGNECAKYPDQMSQHCALVCLNCAKHCRNFAGMSR